MRNNKGQIMRKRSLYRCIFIFSVLLLFIGVIGLVFHINNNNKYVIFLDNMGEGKFEISKLEQIEKQYEDTLNIVQIDYDWNGEFTESNNPKEIVIHHTDTSKETPQQINEAHKDKGWNGIGYHFYITKDGVIYRGRPEEVIGSHVYGRNRDTIGICLEGNFEKEKPTDAQMNSLISLSSDMIIKYNITDIVGHFDLNSTLCPGKNFPMDDYKQKVVDNLLRMYND